VRTRDDAARLLRALGGDAAALAALGGGGAPRASLFDVRVIIRFNL
jgi:hypothetical protein